MLDGWRRFSFTKHWARQVSGLYPEPKVETELPEELRSELLPSLEPEAQRLEKRRQETVVRIDSRARRMVPLGLSPLLLIFVPGMGLGIPVILSLAGGLIGWGVAARAPASEWQKQMREGFGQVLAERLSGFAHVSMPPPDVERLNALRLFGKIIKVDVSDRLTGHRDGRDLALSCMAIKYSAVENPITSRDGRDYPILYTDMVEVETAAKDAPLIVGVGKTPYDVLRNTPAKVHGLTSFETHDPGFDAKFYLFSSDPEAAKRFLTEKLRTALIAVSERHGLEPPHLVIMPGYLAVLFPRLTLKTAFQSRPYWVPVDAEKTLMQFASDLAGRNAMINDVRALPVT
ncbi:MAG: hypothetical protein R6U99_05765 [Nioella sp.]